MMVTTYLETFIFTHIFFQNPQRNLSPIWNLFNSRIDIRDTKKKIDYMKLTNISRILTCTDVSHQCHTKLVYFRSRCREISHQCRKQLGLNFQSSDSDRCTENRVVVNECWKNTNMRHCSMKICQNIHVSLTYLFISFWLLAGQRRWSWRLTDWRRVHVNRRCIWRLWNSLTSCSGMRKGGT